MPVVAMMRGRLSGIVRDVVAAGAAAGTARPFIREVAPIVDGPPRRAGARRAGRVRSLRLAPAGAHPGIFVSATYAAGSAPYSYRPAAFPAPRARCRIPARARICYAAAMTRIAVASDLHIEFDREGAPEAPFEAEAGHPRDGPDLAAVRGEVDLLILAGDIDLDTAGIAYADEAARFLGVPVVYVMGNHEAYHGDLDAVLESCRREAAGTGGRVLFLENDAATVAGVRVLGCTLWTDYALNGNAAAGMQAAAAGLADHVLIRASGRRFTPAHAFTRHTRSRGWLERELARPSAEPVVIATHHAPVRAAVEPRFEGSELSPAFVSDLEYLIDAHGPAAWVWGHTHYSVDTTLGDTRCVSAQRGYPGEYAEPGRFRPAVIEV